MSSSDVSRGSVSSSNVSRRILSSTDVSRGSVSSSDVSKRRFSVIQRGKCCDAFAFLVVRGDRLMSGR